MFSSCSIIVGKEYSLWMIKADTFFLWWFGLSLSGMHSVFFDLLILASFIFSINLAVNVLFSEFSSLLILFHTIKAITGNIAISRTNFLVFKIAVDFSCLFKWNANSTTDFDILDCVSRIGQVISKINTFVFFDVFRSFFKIMNIWRFMNLIWT